MKGEIKDTPNTLIYFKTFSLIESVKNTWEFQNIFIVFYYKKMEIPIFYQFLT